MSLERLTLDSRELVNRLVVEASAGTGKTFSVAGLVTHAIAVRDDLRVSEILITTFTRNAAAELRDRVRRRIVDTARALETVGETSSTEVDPVLALLLESGVEPLVMARRLRRAESEFDSATISTIHGVCNRILALAGRGTVDTGSGRDTTDLVTRAVNDVLVVDAVTSRLLVDVSEARLAKVVEAALAVDEDLLLLHVSEAVDPAVATALLNAVSRCVERVRRESLHSPSYDDLVRVAAGIIANDPDGEISRKFKDRFTLAFVDEAQDTDDQQWTLFHAAFPEGESGNRALVAVGDPKQAIYSFRGADVQSYLDARDGAPLRSLAENQRSDAGLVAALNSLFSGAGFGEGIDYHDVSAASRNAETRIRGSKPLELVDVGPVSAQGDLVPLVASRVIEILNDCRLASRGDTAVETPVSPDQICVLVGAKHMGRAVEAELRRRGVPAVSNGTESVMSGDLARALRVLFEGLERPSDVGRARQIAASPFVGVPLTDPRVVDDAWIAELQTRLSQWAGILRRSGIAALGARLAADASVVEALTATSAGERYLADLSHLVDLIHSHAASHGSAGDGISPVRALEIMTELTEVDDTADTVSRRVESDSQAVQIMTIHSAKGLQFPCVVVADLWKPDRGGNAVPVYRVDHADGHRRTVDVGWAISGDMVDPVSREVLEARAVEELGRLLYVAMTRPEHHVTLFHTSGTDKPSIVDRTVSFERARGDVDHVSSRSADDLGFTVRRGEVGSTSTAAELEVAPAPSPVVATLSRTSFSGITARQAGRLTESDGFRKTGSGHDEEAPDTSAFTRRVHRYAGPDVPVHGSRDLEMPLARVPGGTHLGTVLHSVYEDVDPSATDANAMVEAAVARHATSPSLGPWAESLVRGVRLSYETPLGGPFGDRSLASFTPADRLCELDFEMAVAPLTAGVLVSDIGRVLTDVLPAGDVLGDYAHALCDRSFDVPLGGIVNGSIDAVLRVRDTGDGIRDRLFITDYKTNRLDVEGDVALIDAYRPERLLEAMVHHHYPLQALIYGTAMHRYVSWRTGASESANRASIDGVAYFFVRGMVGRDTPGASDGAPHGVFHWSAPPGLWESLSACLFGAPR